MTVKYIIGHWTAGNYNPCQIDFDSYQILINGYGNEILTHKPQGESGSIAGMNSITFNISCCGGLDRTPITVVQLETFCKVCARELKRFNLKVSDFYTHAEIGQMVKNKTITRLVPLNKNLKDNVGKIDLTRLPHPNVTSQNHGNFIRQKISECLKVV